MISDVNRTRELISLFDFKKLFIEELGWDHYNAQLNVLVDDQTVTLSAVAEKRGMTVLIHTTQNGETIPDYATRRKIERQVTKHAYEHLIVFVDANKTTQIWQWVKRVQGKPAVCREHTYHTGQPGDALIQKLQSLVFTLNEEENLVLPEVAGRVKHAFDVEHVTRRFYDRFKDEHASFLKFLKGIPDEAMERWYVSVMLNRLMFIYFIQKKSFLNNDSNYLQNKLVESKTHSEDRFYIDFLCPLFFDGFAKPKEARSEKIRKLLGEIPYLNGGIFMPHQIERQYGNNIEIPDKTFERLFNFFEEWDWHLDVRQNRPDNEINPDVLGYIFEKYINQKQMGAYYTKEDITEYISKNTVIPFLFDTASKKCSIAFSENNDKSSGSEGEYSIWRILKEDPDRYIYNAVKHGIKVDIHNQPFTILEKPLDLPQEIAAGLNDVSKRIEWNKPAPSEYALPTEIWREVVARRRRYEEIHAKLVQGEINSINDFITYNLDIRQFAQDVISNAEGPDLLYAFWQAMEHVTILDPTVGSGAFLFAALNILEDLYEATLDRMRTFLEEWERSGSKDHPNYSKLFKDILRRVEQHPNTKYFIFKSIIINNLYGVDIMEEAVEICKLRLFLKLVAQVDRVQDIEPLPDIDFNIRAGNTLVGFVSLEQIKHAAEHEQTGQGRLVFGEVEKKIKQIEENAEIADHAFQMFHKMQTDQGMSPKDFAESKVNLRNGLNKLSNELDEYLAIEYKIDINKKKDFEKWRTTHQPFHWFTEFYGILKKGGFDVIIGNPPYVEYSKVSKDYTIKDYETESCDNLYAFIIERNTSLIRNSGRSGMIVPHSAICTDRMEALQHILNKNAIWISSYSIRPAKLFVGVDQRLAIYLTWDTNELPKTYSSTYHLWNKEFRLHLFTSIEHTDIKAINFSNSIPKIHYQIEQILWKKIIRFKPLNELFARSNKNKLYFHNAPRYWIRAMDFEPYFWNARDGKKVSAHVKTLHFEHKADVSVVAALLNSSLFYWWFIILSDCRDLILREIERFPVGLSQMQKSIKSELTQLSQQLMLDLKQHKQRKKAQYKATGKVIYDEFYPKYSKPIIDKIDHALAQHYGFTDEELDYIINYDIKYRMGKESQEDDEE